MFDGEQPLIHGSWPARESVTWIAVATHDPYKPIRSRPVPDKVESEGFRTTPFGKLEFFLYDVSDEATAIPDGAVCELDA